MSVTNNKLPLPDEVFSIALEYLGLTDQSASLSSEQRKNIRPLLGVSKTLSQLVHQIALATPLWNPLAPEDPTQLQAYLRRFIEERSIGRLTGRKPAMQCYATHQQRPAPGNTISNEQIVFSPNKSQVAFLKNVSTGLNTLLGWVSLFSEISIVDLNSGKLQYTLQARDPFSGCFFSPDGSKIALFDPNNVRMLDGISGKLLYVIARFSPTSDSICIFSPDGTKMLIENRTGCDAFDTSSGKKLYPLQDVPSHLPLQAIHFTPNGQHLVCLSVSRIKVWSAQSGDTLYTLPQATSTPNRAYTLNRDGSQIIYATDDAIKVVDTASGTLLSTLKFGAVTYLALTQDGSKIVAHNRYDLKAWSTARWELQYTLPVAAERFDIEKVILSPDGTKIAIVQSKKGLSWNPGGEMPLCLSILCSHKRTERPLASIFSGDQILFSLDGSSLAVTSSPYKDESLFRTWDTTSGDILHSISIPSQRSFMSRPCTNATNSLNGWMVANWSLDGRIEVRRPGFLGETPARAQENMQETLQLIKDMIEGTERTDRTEAIKEAVKATRIRYQLLAPPQTSKSCSVS